MKTGKGSSPLKGTVSGRGRKKIFIVEDHPVTRRGMVQLINEEADLAVCGEAENTPQALAAMRSRKPDLALVDISLPGRSGLELIKDLQALYPRMAIVVMSMHDETIYAERVLRAGGRGYVMKSEGGDRLLDAIRMVLQGELYVSETMSARILNGFARHQTHTDRSALSELTDREFEVFQCLGEGLTAREIGQRLNLSSKTVDTHRLNIKAKLRLRTMPELMKYAVRWAATEQLI